MRSAVKDLSVNIWVVTISEPLPTDQYGDKLHRAGMLATILVERGHNVFWWTSTFDHNRKKNRYPKDTLLDVSPHFKIFCMRSLGYSRNVSLRRFLDHFLLGSKFKKLAKAHPVPDLIICSMPPLELCKYAVDFGNQHHIPVVIDLRDMWPDIFLDIFPWPFNVLLKPLFFPMFWFLKKSCQKATTLVGITPEFVSWGLRLAGRKQTPCDRHFWLGHQEPSVSEKQLAAARKKWRTLGLNASEGDFICSYFGSMSNKLDMEPVFSAARVLQKTHPNIKFVLCGTGDQLERYKTLALGLNNVFFPGWVNAVEIFALMQISSIGLAPYRSRFDFRLSIPTKAIEYMAGRLPILSSLRGSLEAFLEREQCGFTYANGSSLGFQKVLLTLATDTALRKSFAAKSRQCFEREFSSGRVYGDMAEFLVGINRVTK